MHNETLSAIIAVITAMMAALCLCYMKDKKYAVALVVVLCVFGTLFAALFSR
jgi:hypothetical protein